MTRDQEKTVLDAAKGIADVARLINAGLITKEEMMNRINRQIEQAPNTDRTASDLGAAVDIMKMQALTATAPKNTATEQVAAALKDNAKSGVESDGADEDAAAVNLLINSYKKQYGGAK
jgi:hypothetical protein